MKTAMLAAALGTLLLGAGTLKAQRDERTEEPAYEVVASDGTLELRDYPELIVAETIHAGTRRRASGMGFRRLAAYIFGYERPGAEGAGAIAMTAPVLQDRPRQAEPQIAMTAPVLQDAARPGEWRTRFIMPSEWTLDTLPEAAADVTLTTVPARRVATIRFNGDGNAIDLAAQEKRLREWIGAEGWKVAGAAEYAFYDAPMVSPVDRRNEVMIPVTD